MRLFLLTILLASNSAHATCEPDLVRAAMDGLGQVYRSGWQRRGVPNQIGETVLAHSRKVAHAAAIYPVVGINRERLILMALYHDIAEHEVPDFTPHDMITVAEKHSLERAAILKLESALILSLWEEYEAQETAEAKIVFQLDKLDAAIQALAYLRLGFPVSDFFDYTAGKLSDPRLQEILLRLRELEPANPYEEYFKLLRSNP